VHPTGWVGQAGTYLLRVHFTPYWTLISGSLCRRRIPTDMTELEIKRPGTFSLSAAEGADALLPILFDDDASRSLSCTQRGQRHKRVTRSAQHAAWVKAHFSEAPKRSLLRSDPDQSEELARRLRGLQIVHRSPHCFVRPRRHCDPVPSRRTGCSGCVTTAKVIN
jgi:hypothetical protein